MDVLSDPTFWSEVAISAAARLAVAAVVLWGVWMMPGRRREAVAAPAGVNRLPARVEESAVEGSRRLRMKSRREDRHERLTGAPAPARQPQQRKITVEGETSATRQRIAAYLANAPERERTDSR